MAGKGEDAARAGDGEMDQGFAKRRWHGVSDFLLCRLVPQAVVTLPVTAIIAEMAFWSV
jgi:hypothetical protein